MFSMFRKKGWIVVKKADFEFLRFRLFDVKIGNLLSIIFDGMKKK